MERVPAPCWNRDGEGRDRMDIGSHHARPIAPRSSMCPRRCVTRLCRQSRMSTPRLKSQSAFGLRIRHASHARPVLQAPAATWHRCLFRIAQRPRDSRTALPVWWADAPAGEQRRVCAQRHRQRTGEPAQCDYMKRASAPATHMLLIIVGVLITAMAVLRVVRVPVPGLGHPPDLGSVSEQWLEEHRAEHP